MEIERKFIVTDPPEEALEAPSAALRQGYLAGGSGGSVRIRQSDDSFTLTVKRGAGLVREEHEIAITGAQFEALWPVTESQRVEKRRHRIAYGDLTIELDVFGGTLRGLLLAEVEFPDTTAAEAFNPPAWFGAEVTTDGRYTNASLALHGLPDCPPAGDCEFPLS